MLYQQQAKITPEFLEYAKSLTEEQIKRDMLYQLIKSIPMDVLEKIFTFEIHNPFTEESWRKIIRFHPDRELLLLLQKQEVIQYTCKIYV